MNTPPFTPTTSPKGKRRRTTKRTASSPSRQTASAVIDSPSASNDSTLQQRQRPPGTFNEGEEYDDADLLNFSTGDATQASDLTPVGVKTSPELAAAVQSFDSLLASQNDTLGSLMNSPSGSGSPGDNDDDDDDLGLELERLARDRELLQKELNIVASAHDRRRPRGQPRPSQPQQIVPLSPLMERSAPEEQPPSHQSQNREEAKLELTESPIPPGGSNVNTPAQPTHVRIRPDYDDNAIVEDSQATPDNWHGHLQDAQRTHPVTPLHQSATPGSADTMQISSSSSSNAPGSSSESTTTLILDESGGGGGDEKGGSSSSASSGAVPSSSSSSSAESSGDAVRLELSGDAQPPAAVRSSPLTPASLAAGGITPIDERRAATADELQNPTSHSKSLATGELIPSHSRKSPTRGTSSPTRSKGKKTTSEQSEPNQSPDQLRIKSLATGALVHSPGKKHPRSSSPSMPHPREDRSATDQPTVPQAATAPHQPTIPPQPTSSARTGSPLRHLPKARKLFPTWATPTKRKPPLHDSEISSGANTPEPSSSQAEALHPPSATIASADTVGASQGTEQESEVQRPSLPSVLPISASPTVAKSLVTGAFVTKQPSSSSRPKALHLPPPPPLTASSWQAQEVQQLNLSDESATTSAGPPAPAPLPEPPLSPIQSQSSLSPDALRVGTAMGFLGGYEDRDGSSGSDGNGRSLDYDDAEQSESNPSPPQPTTHASHSDAEVASYPVPQELTTGELVGDHDVRPSTTVTTDGLTPDATWDSVSDQAIPEGPSAPTTPLKEELESELPSASTGVPEYDEEKGQPRQSAKLAAGAADVTAAKLGAGEGRDALRPRPDHGKGTDDQQDRRKICGWLRSGWNWALIAVLILSIVVLVSTTVVLTRQRKSESSTIVGPPTHAPVLTPSTAPSRIRSPVPAPSSTTNVPSISLPPNHTLYPTYSAGPTLSPVSQDLFDYLVSISPDGGEALHNKTTPQYQAFLWLAGNQDLASYSPMRLRQRYSLATFYYSTNGNQWSVSTNWLTNESECNWFSRALFQTICGPNGEFQRLELSYNNLDGIIPPELGLLSDTLQNMSLSGGPTRYLTGTIPTYIGTLTNLGNLRLWNNRLSGTIITEFGKLTGLRYLDLSMNLLTGSVVTEIGQLENLVWLDLSVNNVTGRIPIELGNISNLKFLDLSSNGLTGPIPTSLGNLTLLEALNLGGNRLTRINSNVGKMLALESLSLSDNLLGSTIPDSIGRLSLLQSLNLTRNQLTGTLPSTMGRLKQLRDGLDVSFNRLTGTLPSWLGELDGSLRSLSLNSNLFNGTVPESFALLTSVNLLRLDSNNLVGTMPQAVCQVFQQTQPSVFVDCSELQCSCCNYCCTESGCTCRYADSVDAWKCFYR